MPETRIEKDSLGEMAVPVDALYGAQTARAVENFPISGRTMPRPFLAAMGAIKLAAARTNARLGLLPGELADLIATAAEEVIDGRLDGHFPVDVYQTGSGTSTNMNVNEVIANRAIQLAGGVIGSKSPVHPNDHVNMGQSSNDVIPSAIHVSAAVEIVEQLIPALQALLEALESKADEFDSIIKIGRTHLQDAVPIRLGQEFGGYAAAVGNCIGHLEHAVESLGELAIGGTAVGTGLNTHPEFDVGVCHALSEYYGIGFRDAANHFAIQSNMDMVMQTSGTLRTSAVALGKIANDIRLMGSGPRCGIGELNLPAVQPGSSIMPGKVNPVICEAMIQVACQVIGNDAAVTAGATGGVGSILELNMAMPMIAVNLLDSIRLLGAAVEVFRTKCVVGLTANAERCGQLVEQSLAMCTALATAIGYDAAAEIAKEAFKTGKTVRQVATERQVLPTDKLNDLLDLRGQTER